MTSVTDTKKFMYLLETFSLSQHVSRPTHLSGHTLDPREDKGDREGILHTHPIP